MRTTVTATSGRPHPRCSEADDRSSLGTARWTPVAVPWLPVTATGRMLGTATRRYPPLSTTDHRGEPLGLLVGEQPRSDQESLSGRRFHAESAPAPRNHVHREVGVAPVLELRFR